MTKRCELCFTDVDESMLITNCNYNCCNDCIHTFASAAKENNMIKLNIVILRMSFKKLKNLASDSFFHGKETEITLIAMNECILKLRELSKSGSIGPNNAILEEMIMDLENILSQQFPHEQISYYDFIQSLKSNQ